MVDHETFRVTLTPDRRTWAVTSNGGPGAIALATDTKEMAVRIAHMIAKGAKRAKVVVHTENGAVEYRRVE